jgi:hypothetical protein
MKPAPKIAITRFGAGVHSFWNQERSPYRHRAVSDQSWNESAMGGYFVPWRIAQAC